MWKNHYEIFMSAKFKDFQMDMPNTKKWTEDLCKDKDNIFMISTVDGKKLPMGFIHFLKIKTNLIFMIWFQIIW